LTDFDQKNSPSLCKVKRGIPVYQFNPSVPSESEIKKYKRSVIGSDQKGLILDNSSGEILGHGGAMSYEWEEIDKEKFVKLYVACFRQAAGFSRAALTLFENVYTQVRDNPGKDTVLLDPMSTGLEERAYRRGLRELLEKEYIFRSPNPGLFFVNVRVIFNGDRLALVKGYTLKKENDLLK
jgi:hypothetical protein